MSKDDQLRRALDRTRIRSGSDPTTELNRLKAEVNRLNQLVAALMDGQAGNVQ